MIRIHSTCLHEAAHAAVAYCLRVPVRAVAVKKDGSGYVDLGLSKSCPIYRAVATLAGYEAQAQFLGESHIAHAVHAIGEPKSDYHDLRRDGFSPEALELIIPLASKYVKQYRKRIIFLARELERRMPCRLPAKEFLTLMEQFNKAHGVTP